MLAQQFSALGLANGRYWLTVHRVVRRELERWRVHADRLEGARRAVALGKLDDAGPHALITATFATLAPRAHRERATVAIVALEVMYDYLDALTEEGVGLDEGRELFRALEAPFGSHEPDDPYLHALAATCRMAVGSLPAVDAISPTAADIAAHCGEAQIRSHLAARNPAQLAAWATRHTPADMLWWEAAAGMAASILTVHALIAAASDRRTSQADAQHLADSYLLACALTTMLDSLLDREADAIDGAHSYVAYYEAGEIAARLAYLALAAVDSAQAQRRGAHHAMTVAGIAGYYLSDPAAGPETLPVRAELEPVVSPVLWMFKAWRASSRLRH